MKWYGSTSFDQNCAMTVPIHQSSNVICILIACKLVRSGQMSYSHDTRLTISFLKLWKQMWNNWNGKRVARWRNSLFGGRRDCVLKRPVKVVRKWQNRDTHLAIKWILCTQKRLQNWISPLMPFELIFSNSHSKCNLHCQAIFTFISRHSLLFMTSALDWTVAE